MKNKIKLLTGIKRIMVLMNQNTVTVNQLLFGCEKFMRGSQEPRRHEYFSSRISRNVILLITIRV